MQQGFLPIAKEDARVLFLGTGPSRVSLLKGEYYGHPSNVFWKMLSCFFQEPIKTYEQKRELLISHQIALWDTLKSFERIGSLDSGYREVVPNDLIPFIQSHPFLKAVGFTGRKAETFYRRFVSWYPKGITFLTLPSTSAAYTLSFAQKYLAYKTFLERFLLD